jgi:glutamate synthase domain-containing protein 2
MKRAAGEGMHAPFGTEYDYRAPGHEWMLHSMHPVVVDPARLRVRFGGLACRRPYEASLLNVAGMSYGSISPEATRALAVAARLGGFASNTGEGGVADAHLQGGDLVFQLGTGYFGCRTKDGRFDEDGFRRCVAHASVRMVEIKISQGAKPGFGAILPAHKNTAEIAGIRGIEPGVAVHSPPGHSAFSTPDELCAFVARLRELADGRPVGIKLCVGRVDEWRALVDAMVRHGPPDFVAVDGGEGGTGAAALESLHWVGMPLEEALVEVVDSLVVAGLRDEVRVVAAGRSPRRSTSCGSSRSARTPCTPRAR